MTNHPHAELPCAAFNRLEDARRDVMGVDVNGHGMVRHLPGQRDRGREVERIGVVGRPLHRMAFMRGT